MMRCPARPSSSIPPVAGDAEAAEQQAEDIAVTLVRQALKEHKGSKHPVAVLVRARSHLGNMTRRLTQEGISCRAVDLVPLALRPVVADLVQLLRALSHPADRLAWLSVLRAPFCGLTLTSLQRLFGEDHVTPVPVLLERAARTGSGVSRLADARTGLAVRSAARCAGGRGPGRTARARRAGRGRVRTPAPGRRRPAGRAQRFRRHALRGLGRGLLATPWRSGAVHGLSVANDAESLFQLVERLAPHGAIDMAALEAGIARLFAAPDAAGEDGAVEIMTMHKSKGLQFETVILYGLHRAPRGDQAPLVRFEQNADRVLFGPVKPRAETEADPVSRYLGAREARRASYEVDRLLYVAATRARKRLHLVGHVSVDDAGQAKTRQRPACLAACGPG